MKTTNILLLLISLFLLISCDDNFNPPVANFEISNDNSDVGELITFTNTSSLADDFEWSFGDGQYSADENPVHTYLTSGSFTVMLKARGDGGIDTLSRQIIISEPHEIGNWTLESFVITNVPNEYSNFEGSVLSIQNFSWESYSLRLMNDGSFNRAIKQIAYKEFNDYGNWYIESDILYLTKPNTLDEEWSLLKNENDQLAMSGQPTTFFLPKNEISDTISADYLFNLTQDQYDLYWDEIPIDLVYSLIRED